MAMITILKKWDLADLYARINELFFYRREMARKALMKNIMGGWIGAPTPVLSSLREKEREAAHEGEEFFHASQYDKAKEPEYRVWHQNKWDCYAKKPS
jgi:hypothetical protein